MPSDPPELHAKWKDDQTASQFLLKAGYKVDKFMWIKPTPDHQEVECLWLKITSLEWDWGGIVGEDAP